MPNIHYLLDNQDIEANAGETILQASLRAGIPHTHACGGHARCSTCRVMIVAGVEHCPPRNAAEQAMADRLKFRSTIRLACQTTFTGDVTLRRLVLDEEDETLVKELRAVGGSVGDEKRLAILFADIRGFTPFAEALPPYDVVHVLNRFYRHMGSAIERSGGTINNYMGDGLLALFGLESPPHPQPLSPNEERGGIALQAVRAGVAMLEAMEQFKPYLRAVYGKSFEIGIGVHVGDVIVGSVGAARSQRLTAIGDAVNLASRIEEANKQVGTHFLISAEMRTELGGRVRTGKSVSLTLPGKSGEYVVYEVAGVD